MGQGRNEVEAMLESETETEITSQGAVKATQTSWENQRLEDN